MSGMLHLSIERLAALADEQPTADERAHLVSCELCARELQAQRALFSMAASERESIGVPLTEWDTLANRLKTEGLIVPSAARRDYSVGLRAAAVLLLIGAGALIGRASAGTALIPGGFTGTEPTEVSARAVPDSLPTTFASVEEARRWRRVYANAYQSTVTYLAANDSGSQETPAVMRTRLSALDRVSRAMREALNDAPYDPVINDFYLNSFGQREATLRQLNAVLPQGVRLNSF
jgi:hypothetical protein